MTNKGLSHHFFSEGDEGYIADMPDLSLFGVRENTGKDLLSKGPYCENRLHYPAVY